MLVTGAAGFVGSHLVDRLVADGHRVAGLDDLSGGRLRNLSDARKVKGLSFHKFDITEPELEDVLAREHPDVVFHLAAARGAGAEREALVNVVATARLMQASARTTVQRLVLASDATAVYAPARKPVSERAGLGPLTAFGASKAAAETYVESLSRALGLPAVVLRLGSVYGPRAQRGVVAAFQASMASGRPGTVFGDGSVRRDLVHVDDVVDALLRCAGGKADGRRLNIGSGVGTSVRELHALMAGLTGVADAPEFAPARAGEPATVVVESAAARRALGWETTTTLDSGLARLLG